MNKTLRLSSLQVSKHLRCFRLSLLTLLLCGSMQAMAETWTDASGLTWSFTANGTEATDIKFRGGPDIKKVYLYGDVENYPDQVPFVPGAWDAAAMRFSSTEGAHLPTIPDDVYFGLKTLIFDVSDVTDNFDLKVMNGWWSNTYYDHVKWENGLNELQITDVMARECAKGGEGRDLDLMLYSGSMTLNAVYYESSEVYGDLVIPAKVYAGSTELTVTSIGNFAFVGYAGLTSVTIPEGVTSIGDNAFMNCNSLTSVTIPEGVTSIGNGVFSNCYSLTSVTIPEGVTSIGNNTFYDCYNLTRVTIPSSVTSIGDYAFAYCSVLTDVTIPSSVTSIGNNAFCVCLGLTSMTIPEGVTSIGNNAFNACSGLASVTIPSSVTSIGDLAFACTGLTSISVASGNSVYDSRNNCNAIIETATNTLIQGCNNTIIPESVTSIGNEAFYYCSGLTSVTIPEGVTSIGNSAFCDCYSLTSVTIPSSVTSIGNYAFYWCYGLTSISVESGNSVYDSRNNCNAIIETASNTLIAGCNNTIIPEGVTSIGDGAFAACAGLTSVTIPEGVTSIGNYAFDCTSLTSVTIPSSVTNIGLGAFYNCYGLTSVTIPSSVTSIGSWAFYRCSGLTSVTSLIKEPFAITNDVFMVYEEYDDGSWYYGFTSAPLYVPAGTKSLYEATPAWNQFQNIVEMGETEGIHSIDNGQLTMDNYYSLDGRKIEGVPTQKGVYIVNGKKVVKK